MKTIISWLFILILLITSIGWLSFAWTINRQVNIPLNTVLTITAGQGLEQIAQQLADQKLIRSAFFFKVHAVLSGQQAKFQAGEYLLDQSLDTKQLTRILTSGLSLNQEKTVLIREGLNLKEIADYLDKQQLLNGQEFLVLAQTPIKDLPADFDQYEFLQAISGKVDLEGYLFPDTYRLYKEAAAQDLILKMLDNFQAKLTPDLLDDMAKQKKDLEQIITMASLIEKEVKTYEDMRIVSGIFWQRLAIRQPLQSCATLAYVLGVNKEQYNYEDTQVKSPYNTYLHYGLPPSPISNPGLTAIKAAIYPVETDYNYFLSRPDNGQTVFAKTLDEHNANKAKYLR